MFSIPRRAPPPPPAEQKSLPVPTRHGPGSKAAPFNDADVPPPLPNRPGATPLDAQEDMYEDMSGGVPYIIDIKPPAKKSSTVLPPSHIAPQSHADIRQQNQALDGNLYELPSPIASSEPSGLNTNISQRENDMDEEFWSDSEWDDASDGIAPSPEDAIYEDPEPFSPQCEDDDDVPYEQPDEVSFRKMPPAMGLPMAGINASTIQLGLKKLNNVKDSQPAPEPVSSRKGISAALQGLKDKISKPAHNKSEQTKEGKSKPSDKPKPPPKPRGKTANSSGIHGSAQAFSAKFEGTSTKEVTETTPDDNSSSGSASSHSGGQLPSNMNRTKGTAFAPSETSIKQNGTSEPPKKTPVLPLKPHHAESSVDEIYEEAVSETLDSYDWFHGKVDRSDAVSRVKELGKIGGFLIRTSQSTPTPDGDCHRYTLVVMNKSNVQNLKIRQRGDGKFAIGSKRTSDELCFTSLPDLVAHHRDNNVKFLKDEELVKLASSPKRRH